MTTYRITWFSWWVGEYITYITTRTAASEAEAAAATKNEAASKADYISPEEIVIVAVEVVG